MDMPIPQYETYGFLNLTMPNPFNFIYHVMILLHVA